MALAQDTSREANLIESKAQQVSSVLADNLLGETKQIEDAEAVFVGIGGECHVDRQPCKRLHQDLHQWALPRHDPALGRHLPVRHERQQLREITSP